jgi:hypothetical protein
MDPQRRTRAWVLPGILMLSAAAGMGWWGGRASTQASEALAHAPVDEALQSQASVPEAPTSTPILEITVAGPSAVPLPDLSMPLRNALPELKRRADAGEPAAACRLAAEIEFCDDVSRRLDEAANELHYPGTGADHAANAEFAARQRQAREAAATRGERLLQESTHCEGVPQFMSGERLRYWRTAALGGSLPAINYYVMGRAFRPDDTLDNLDALRLYRSEVEAIAMRGIAAGDVSTTLAMAGAYSPQRRSQRSLLYQAVKPDAGKALALYLQAQALLNQPQQGMPAQGHLFDSAVRDLERKLDHASLTRAREQAAAYRRAAPAPALPPSRSRTGNWLPSGGPTSLLRAQCTP